MNLTKPFFHQKFYSSYIVLLFTLLCISLATFALIKVREMGFQEQLSSRLPQLETAQKQQVIINKAQESLKVLLFSDKADNFIAEHEALEKSLSQLMQLNTEQNLADFPYLAQKNQIQQIIRIAGKDQNNQELVLKTQADIARSLVGFKAFIDLKIKRAAELLYLINNDAFNEQVTVVRAKAHAKLVTSITQDQLAFNQLNNIAYFIPAINLQVQEQVIENIAKMSDLFFSWFSEEKKTMASENKILFEQLVELERLLQSDQRLISKWRGHIRLYNEYKVLAVAQVTHLTQITEQLTHQLATPSNEKSALADFEKQLPLWLTNSLKQMNIKLSYSLIVMMLTITIIIGAVVIVALLMRFNRCIQQASAQQISVIEDSLALAENIKTTTYEEEKIVNLLTCVIKPKFTEQEVTKLVAKFTHQLNAVANFHQATYWSFEQQTADFTQPLVDKKVILAELLDIQPIKSIRACFTKLSIKEFINAAKKVKKTAQPTSLVLEAITGQQILITINYQTEFQKTADVAFLHNAYLHGTLGFTFSHGHEVSSVASEADLVAHSVLESAAVLAALKDTQVNENIVLSNTINDKIIKAMLQSQAECLTKKRANSSLYKQLNRLFIWGQETQLHANVSSELFQLTLSETCLQSQILAALANVTAEMKGQKNIAQFDDNLPELCSVQLDPVLFNATILGLVRLMLTRLRNSQLSVSTHLHDRNDGQYIVKYQFSLTTEQKAIQPPVELASLLADNSDVKFDAVNFIRELLQRQHASEIHLDTTDSGYQLSFNLPHTIVIKNKAKIEQPLVDLTQKHILYVSDLDDASLVNSDKTNAKLTDSLIYKTLQSTKAKLICVGNIAQAQAYLTEEQLKIRQINMVVLATTKLQVEISTMIEALKVKQQPKLFILSGKPYASVAQGIYSLSAMPFDKYALLAGISELHGAKNKSNKVISDEELSSAVYQHTGVEVLLAVANISQHNVLVQLLNFMGFNITVVVSAVEMLPLWRSGKYLILISEFDNSPVIELQNGLQVQRALIGFNATQVNEWQKQVKGKQWQFACLPKILKLDNLAAILATWLVIKEQPKQMKSADSSMPLMPSRGNKVMTQEVNAFESLPAAFNLQQFVENQAGVELAVMMMDDYITENQQLVQKLSYAISVKSQEHLNKYLNQLILNAQVMAAAELLDVCWSIKTHIAEKNYQLAQSSIAKLQDEVALVAQYAEAI